MGKSYKAKANFEKYMLKHQSKLLGVNEERTRIVKLKNEITGSLAQLHKEADTTQQQHTRAQKADTYIQTQLNKAKEACPKRELPPKTRKREDEALHEETKRPHKLTTEDQDSRERSEEQSRTPSLLSSSEEEMDDGEEEERAKQR